MPQVTNASSGSVPTSPQLAATLQRAFVYAEEQAHRQVTAEHLLLALTEDSDAAGILQRKGIDIDHMRNEVAGLVSGNNDRFEAADAGQPAYGADLLRVMGTASGAASPRRPVDGALVLAALIADGTTPSAELIKLYGLTFDDITRLPPGVAAPAPSYTPPLVQMPAQPPALASVRAAAREIALGQQRTRRDFPAPAPQQTQPTGSTLRRPPASYQLPPHDDYAEGGPVNGHGAMNGYGTVPQPAAFRQTPAPQQSFAPPSAAWPQDNYAPPAVAADWDQYAYPEADAASFAEQAPAWTDSAPVDIEPVRPTRREPEFASEARHARTELAQTARPRPQGRKPAAKGRRQAERSFIVENIPRQMVIGIAHIIEARIARHSVEGLLQGNEGLAMPQDLPATLALTVRLRTPDGGVAIEAGSPETQWMDSVLGLQQDDFASWRWTVTPKWSGATNLQLVASARAVDPSGLMAEMALPDHSVDVRIVTNFGTLAGRSAFWIFLVVLLGGIGAIAESTMHIFSNLFNR